MQGPVFVLVCINHDVKPGIPEIEREKHGDGRDGWHNHRKHHAEHGLEFVCAIDVRRLKHGLGHGFDLAAHHNDVKHAHQRRKDQNAIGVAHVQQVGYHQIRRDQSTAEIHGEHKIVGDKLFAHKILEKQGDK